MVTEVINVRKIIKNSVKCNLCGEIIISEDVHDFKCCKCGAVAVDGGNDYLRRTYRNSPDDYTELSEFEESESAGNVETN
ncbi:MAG: hypothetical protein K2N56_09790 [Oscillospiraceae bacterium]|nr:hypothetical protein [Oscillospiraceae bacterium]